MTSKKQYNADCIHQWKDSPPFIFMHYGSFKTDQGADEAPGHDCPMVSSNVGNGYIEIESLQTCRNAGEQ